MSDVATNLPLPQGSPSSPAQTPSATMRLWPAILIVAGQWLVMFVPRWLAPVSMAHFIGWFLGPLIGTLGLLVWWFFASRLPRWDRWLIMLAFLAGGAITFPFWHETLRDQSSKGFFFLVVYGLPALTTAGVAWLAVTPFLRWPARRAGLVVVLLLTWASFALLRNEGTDGMISSRFRLRFITSDEELLLADLASGKLGTSKAAATKQPPLTLQPGDWPCFRGPNRDSRLTGARIDTDWQAHPPKEVWRHRVGPGWSSFAVVGNRLYTQEQRGADEIVICYDAGNGNELWLHKDTTRFNETMAGPGPRATPTFHEGKIYALGATGKLNCLDAGSGRLIWSRDVMADSGAKLPTWGFAASPLIVQGIVTVFTGGPNGKSVVAYKAGTGDFAWAAGDGQHSYCSLQVVKLDGVEQLLTTSDIGLTAFHPIRGEVLWQHDWPLGGNMSRVVQPALVTPSDFLIGTSFGFGTRRVHVRRDAGKWSTDEVWTSRAIKPYFNDLVVHNDHVYGFDNNILTCMSLKDGARRWRERGYGNGQILLLVDQDLLLILSEQGEVALVEANPAQRKELARIQAIQGKTWNHPVIVRDRLFVRNGAEAACYQLPMLSQHAHLTR